MNSPNENAVQYLRDLADHHFWGFLTLKFEDGKIVHVRREENLKPSELPGKDRVGEYEHRISA